MKKILFFLSFIFFVYSSPICVSEKNFCSKCNQLTNLCINCQNDVLIPDTKGGCKGAGKCYEGKNYCEECNSERNLCQMCRKGYYPDENGGCSYTGNCFISYRGTCLSCVENFILIGQDEGFKICKSLDDDDFLNCKSIDYTTGLCEICKEDYFLNEVDKQCIDTQYCSESVYGKCTSCIQGYYLDLNDKKKCKTNTIEKAFYHCKESEDGETCTKCEGGYYFDEYGNCGISNYCSESKSLYCEKCKDGYYLSANKNSCTTTENCQNGDKDTGICSFCINGYYLDLNDRQCKSNQEEDDLKYCKIFGEKCSSCEYPYELGTDNKCSNAKFCAESENGICKKCIDNYYIGTDHKCSIVEHCLKSNLPSSCDECEKGYYLHRFSNKCIEAKGNMKHCKESNSNNTICEKCKNDYYLVPSEHLCYSNKEEGPLYKCSRTNFNGTECIMCSEGYYFVYEDKVCSSVKNCAKIKDNKCLLCEDTYCLNIKTNSCEDNDYIEEEEKKIHFHCLETNEEGTACKVCLDNYTLGENGLCIDDIHCEKKKNGVCIKCIEEDDNGSYYCLNKEFGCVESFYSNCLKCDDNLSFDYCTECFDGFELHYLGLCLEEDIS